MLVSILSLVYNHENYLEPFFEGILSQEFYDDLEIVIGIDKSSDASLEICRKYQKLHPKTITLLEHKERVGMISNFNKTYNACSGKYIAICEGDDYWIDNQKLAKQVKVLEKDAKAVICFTDIKIFDEEEKKFYPNWAQITKENYSIKDIIKSNPISTCSVLLRNNYIKINDNSFKGLSVVDWSFNIQLLAHGYAKYLDCKTAVYRMSLQSSYSKNPVVQQLFKKKEACEYLLKEPGLYEFRSLLLKAYNLQLYAIAVRLEKNDKRRVLFLKKVIKSIFWNNMLIPVKAFVRLFM